MKTVTIDRTRHLADQPGTGHNRWHPDIPPIVEVEEGEEVALETRDASDGYLTSRSTVADFPTMQVGAIHPLTGPVLVKGARPGDLLEVEFVDIVPQRWAFTAILPGLGFLRDVMTTPYLVHWDIADGVGDVAPAAARPHPGRVVHGRLRRGAVARAGRGVDAPRGRSARARRHGVPTRRGRRRAGDGRRRDPRPAHAAAARERRQLRRQAAQQGRQAPAAGRRRRRAVLDRRRPLRPGRRRGLRHGRRDGRHVRRALSRPPRRGRATRDPLAALSAHRLLHRSALCRAPALHRHDGHARRRAGREPGREPQRRVPQRRC